MVGERPAAFFAAVAWVGNPGTTGAGAGNTGAGAVASWGAGPYSRAGIYPGNDPGNAGFYADDAGWSADDAGWSADDAGAHAPGPGGAGPAVLCPAFRGPHEGV